MRQTRGSQALYLPTDKNDIIRRVPGYEARQMIGTGEAVYICRTCDSHKELARKFCGANARPHEFALTLTGNYKALHRSKPTITFHEVEANVGAVKEGDESLIAAAQRKIQNWPHEFDRLATLVVPREAFA